MAVSGRYGSGVTEAFVDKVYKNGRFTLRGSKQQWRPWSHAWSDTTRWSATETGSGWSRQRLDLWDETTDKELSELLEAERTKTRWRDLQAKVHDIRHPTAALCDAIESALTSR